MGYPWETKKKEDDEGADKFKELMDQVSETKKTNTELSTKVTEISSKLAVLDDVSQFIKDQKEAKAAQEAEAARRKAATDRQEEDENLGTDLLSDTRGTINKVTAPQREAIARIRAKQVLGEVFNDPDNAEKFKYYSGAIRKEVDDMLAAQTLEFQCNPKSVENVYRTVLGAHLDEIMEGKLKTRFATGSGGSSSSGKDTGGGGTTVEKLVITDKLRKAAKLVGFEGREEEYAKMVIEEQESEMV